MAKEDRESFEEKMKRLTEQLKTQFAESARLGGSHSGEFEGVEHLSKKFDTEETILELQGRKSDLLLEAQMILASGNMEEAIERFAAAAPMEERIADFYSKRKDIDETARHKFRDRKSTRLNSSHPRLSRMPSSA